MLRKNNKSEMVDTVMYPPVVYTSQVIPSLLYGNGDNGPTPWNMIEPSLSNSMKFFAPPKLTKGNELFKFTDIIHK